MEEAVESSLEWGERIAGLSVAGGPGIKACILGTKEQDLGTKAIVFKQYKTSSI